MPSNTTDRPPLRRLLVEKSFIQQSLFDISNYIKQSGQDISNTHLQVRLEALNCLWWKFRDVLVKLRLHQEHSRDDGTLDTEQRELCDHFFQTRATILNRIDGIQDLTRPQLILERKGASTGGARTLDILERELSTVTTTRNTPLPSRGLSTVPTQGRKSSTVADVAKGSDLSTFRENISQVDAADTNTAVSNCSIPFTKWNTDVIVVVNDRHLANNRIHNVSRSDTNTEQTERSQGERSQPNFLTNTLGHRCVTGPMETTSHMIRVNRCGSPGPTHTYEVIWLENQLRMHVIGGNTIQTFSVHGVYSHCGRFQGARLVFDPGGYVSRSRCRQEIGYANLSWIIGTLGTTTIHRNVTSATLEGG